MSKKPKPNRDMRLRAHIAKIVSRHLKAAGWSQRRLAAECEVPVMTINNILTKRAMPNAALLLRVCVVLGIPITEALEKDALSS